MTQDTLLKKYNWKNRYLFVVDLFFVGTITELIVIFLLFSGSHPLYLLKEQDSYNYSLFPSLFFPFYLLNYFKQRINMSWFSMFEKK